MSSCGRRALQRLHEAERGAERAKEKLFSQLESVRATSRAEEQQAEKDHKAGGLRKRQEAVPGLINPHARHDAGDMDL